MGFPLSSLPAEPSPDPAITEHHGRAYRLAKHPLGVMSGVAEDVRFDVQ